MLLEHSEKALERGGAFSLQRAPLKLGLFCHSLHKLPNKGIAADGIDEADDDVVVPITGNIYKRWVGARPVVASKRYKPFANTSVEHVEVVRVAIYDFDRWMVGS